MAVQPSGAGRADPGGHCQLLVTGGRLADPEAGTLRPGELAVRDGRIAATGAPGELSGMLAPDGEVLDATGLLVTPGLIDLHTHVYPGRTALGIDPDAAGVRSGVTTVADAGSCGSDGWAHFARTVPPAARTRVLNWLNVSRHGLTRGTSELAGGEADIDADAAVRLLAAEPAVRGVKVRMSRSVLGDSGLAPLRTAKAVAAEAARRLGRRVPVMVHVGNAPPELPDVLGLLGDGDVVTHAFHGKPGGLFAAADEPAAGASTAPAPGRLRPQVREALERGVRFDVGHGSASFAFEVAERALAEGVRPHTISTDLHCRNIDGPVHSLTATLGKLLALGMPLTEVLACATVRAAEVLGTAPALGTLRTGARADLSLLRLRDQRVRLTDSGSPAAVREAGRLIEPHSVVLDGRPLSAGPAAAPATSTTPAAATGPSTGPAPGTK